MTNVKPVFPKAVFSWADRIDEVSNVFANDPNSLASEVISLESTLGVMPQVEKNTYTSKSQTYASVDARISDVNAGTLHPYCELFFSQLTVPNGATYAANIGKAPGKANAYRITYDPWNFYNGTDATISVGASGLYFIHAWQQWPYQTSGYVGQHLYIENALLGQDVFNWSAFPQNGPSAWDRSGFNERHALTQVTWMGSLVQGMRVQIVSENGTGTPNLITTLGSLHIYNLRKLPSNLSA